MQEYVLLLNKPFILEYNDIAPTFYRCMYWFSCEFSYKDEHLSALYTNETRPHSTNLAINSNLDIHILYCDGGDYYEDILVFSDIAATPTEEILHIPPNDEAAATIPAVITPLIPVDFNWKMYLDLNPDIARVFSTKEDAIKHYLQSGIRETRRYKFQHVPDGFEWEIYLDLNPDVKSVIRDRIGALHHYERNGYKEKRGYKYSNIPDDFDWEFYLALNADVKQSYKTRIDAMKHYHYYGKKERRRYNLHHLPADFDCDTYVALNPDIPCRFLHTHSSVKLHYELYGRVAARKYKINRTNVPDDFNWKLYQEFNPSVVFKSELSAIIHYNTIGFYKQLRYKYDGIDSENKTEKGIYLKHPFLFHKYILDVASPSNKLRYERIRNGTQDNVLVTHLHCYNIDLFGNFYGDYIDSIFAISDVVVTYSIGTILPKYENLTLLQIENRGMDIGGKYNAVAYLKEIHHPYKHILFLHSKTDEHTRKMYWRPLIENLDQIQTMTTHSDYDNVGVWTPPLIYMGDYNHCLYTHHQADPTKLNPRWNPGNIWYMDDIDEFMGFQSNNKFFPEGNCFVAKRELAEALYSDLEMYNILNTMTSFDAVWVKAWYGDIQNRNVGTNIYEIYDFYMSNKEILHLHPNNTKLGHLGYRDNMIEHCYERIVFKMVEKMGYDVHIMPPIGLKEPSETHKQFNRLLNRYFKTKQLE